VDTARITLPEGKFAIGIGINYPEADIITNLTEK
jgi:hypothetical protein